MAGIIPNEGKTLIAQVIHKRTHVDRDADLELGLFTDAAPDETITEATISEPTGTGYARKTLVDANWNVVAGVSSYATQTFEAGAGGWTGDIVGYFIATKAAGGTKRLLYVEIDGDAAAPFTMEEGAKYHVTPQTTVS